MSNNTKNDIEILEAPYKLPEGWKWVRLGDFIDIYRGVSYKKTDAHSEKQQNDCLIMRGGNIEEGNINIDADNVYVDKSIVAESQFIKKNDVIIVTSTGSTKVIGRAGISNDNYSDVAFGAFLTLARPNGKADKSFVNHYFQSSLYRERIRQLASGVNINNIRTDYITESPFPLPPNIEEQQRIVNRIESMFAKLDEAKEKVQNVVDSFETRKAAILHQAFTGTLTAKWRKENGVSDDSWEEKNLGKLIVGNPQNGLYKSKDLYGSGTKILRIDCFYDGYVEPWEKLQRLSLKNEDIDIYRLNINDIVINRVNSMPYLGKSALIRELPENCVFESNMMRIVLKVESVIPEYLIKYLNSGLGLQELRKNAKQAVNQASINQQDVKSVKILVPSLPEQQEIVHILDNVLEKKRIAKSAAEQVLEQIDLLKKTILARAFRGEL